MVGRPIAVKGAPQPQGAYSQGIVAGGFVFVSGQGPLDASTGSVVGSTVAEQVVAVFKNVKAILAARGLALDDVVKVNAYLQDIGAFHEYDKVYREVFRPPFPARTTVGAALHGILVEVDVIAKDRGGTSSRAKRRTRREHNQQQSAQ